MKITIITINYNNREGLKKTIASVRSQIDQQFEYIVIDGGSDDGSLEIIKDNEKNIDFYLSEKDSGIYNAMNKGVAHARGEYCLFLNSGDILYDNSVIAEVNASDKLKDDIVFGKVKNIFPNGKSDIYSASDHITLMMIIQTGLHHAGSFIRTSLMKKYPYDEHLKICSDRKFFVQSLIIDNCSYSTLPFIVTEFELGGISFRRTDLAMEESWRIMEELFPPRLVSDYRMTNFRIQKMTAKLVKCRYKIVTLVCAIDNLLIKICRIILGKRIERKK